MTEKQKAIAVGVNINETAENFHYSMEELKGLAEACDIEVIGEITQNLKRVHSSHYIGTGKVDEIKVLIEELEPDLVIFNDELSPSQVRVLEEKLDINIKDRTVLILDIFAERAKTKEAQLQVELAKLSYTLPRLMNQNEDLGRQGGGAGLKNRGAGETKLELDKRKIEGKITSIKKELEVISAQRQTQRQQREKNQIPVVSLVGYTNAGKSTLMNAMIDVFNPNSQKQVFEKDMLFATLDTSVRKINLPHNKSFLLTDTVGFVSKLPHHLVKAFRSTLEEIAQADLIIHVVDCSDVQHEQYIQVTNKTLRGIGVEGIPVIYAYNKADLANIPYPAIDNDKVYLSAKKKVGIDELTQLIQKEIFKDYVHCEFLIPYEQGQIVSYFKEQASVSEVSYEEQGTRMVVECASHDAEKYKGYIV